MTLSIRGFSVISAPGPGALWWQGSSFPPGTIEGDIVLFVLDLTTMIDETTTYNTASVAAAGTTLYLYQTGGNLSGHNLLFVFGVGS